ncbi:Gfo/Idh/MocA family protein [Paenarthrobacter nitroguajacolicus]|uniref:Gfo/Idh/MocA family protein n=1 Tax=Paenarthrobacter nitroguajacolicus TaxID=211146 RepID=UPI00248C9F10|nr:Gfo/Idh/MocA family oxidoreductase [Paenarthrobacter nitroguajacolicus]MDI2034196.1 Inositol 2-dehydrogenase/D-chiro-inositol 3-dehydrogenase [Paenarthrobacter nitroguajacolicus]
MTTAAQPPRVAVVGAAGWAGSRHARAFAKLGASVTHLVEKDERAVQLAQELGAQVVPSVQELHSDHLDLVVVALPTTLQPDICADLLNRGFRVLTEKPVAADADGAAIMAAASGVNERLMVGYTLHQHPAVQLLSQWVRENRVIAVTVRSVAHKQNVDSWRADPKEGGVAVVNGIHAIELVSSWFEGDPDVLAASASSSLYGSPVPEHVVSMLEFPSGVVFTLQSYWSPWQEPQGLNQGDWSLAIDILATGGRMLWSNDSLHVWDRDGGQHENNFEPSDLFLRQAAAALRFCMGETPAVTFAQALRATKIADAVRTARASGAREVPAP